MKEKNIFIKSPALSFRIKVFHRYTPKYPPYATKYNTPPKIFLFAIKIKAKSATNNSNISVLTSIGFTINSIAIASVYVATTLNSQNITSKLNIIQVLKFFIYFPPISSIVINIL